MKSIGTLLLLVASSLAHDAVIFSSTIKITKDAPALTSLIASASTESPLVFFVNPDFVLGQFSKAAAAYSTKKSESSIVNAAKAAKYAESRFISSTVHVPSSSPVSASSPLEKGQSIYLVSAENWSSLDKLAAEVLAVLGDKATVVVTNSEVVSTDPVRVKRVSSKDAAADNSDNTFPIVIPKVETEADRKPCLFYLEGLTFIVKGNDGKYLTAKLRDDGTSTSKKYGYTEPICPDTLSTKANGPQQAIFSFTVNPGSPNKPLDDGWNTLSTIGIELTLTSTIDGYWSLTKAMLTDDLEITFDSSTDKMTVAKGSEATKKSMDYMGLDSVFGFSWNCWDSQALFFGKEKEKQIGVSFHGMQIAVYGKDDGKQTMSYFRTKVDSCTGTFSAASWMGIITSLVLIAVFIFGFLMLNSVQTLDRYDDPKQKQILINVRE